MGKGELWSRGVALHPQDWLDYLVAFTPVEFTNEDKESVAEAVIGTATKFDDHIDLEDYVDIISIRSDLDGKSKSYLEDMVYGSPLEKKLTNAIERGDYEELENQGKKLLSELNEQLKKKVEMDEQLKHASSVAQEEKQRRKQLESIIDDISGVEVNNTQTVSQEVDVTVNQKTINQLEYLEEELRDAVDGPLSETEVPNPPEDYSDPDAVIDWLENLDQKLSTLENYAGRFSHISPMVTGLLASFGI
jgi:hypothetical protein